MIDDQNAAPAGAGDQPVDTSIEGVLAHLEERRRKESEKTGNNPETELIPDNTASEEPGQEPEPAAGEAEQPDGEPSEPEGEDKPDFIPGNALTRMQDGSVRPVGELKKAWGELQELKSQTSDLTAARQEIEQQRASLQQRAQELDQLIAQVGQSGIPPAPSDEMWDTDPIAAMQQWRRHEAAKGQHDKLAAEQQQKAKEARDAFSAEQGRKLLDLNPDLRDQAKAQEFGKAFLDTISSWGFAPQEVDAGSLDHRLVHHAVADHRDALKWRALQADKAKAAKKAEGAAPVQAPGRRLTPGDQRNSQVEALTKRARQSGTIEDAVALLQARRSG